MRRRAIVVGLSACLLLVQASPAFAYKWKRTITVGVDPSGVPIRIDATATEGGHSPDPAGRNSGGAPCTYTLAIAGLDPLFASQQLEANLYSITCGSYTDVR